MSLNQVGSHKTTITENQNFIQINYHSTPVVKFNHKKIILNSGGHRTKTTKLRMNQASNQFNLGFHVYQKNFDWFIDYKNETIEFYNGIELDR